MTSPLRFGIACALAVGFLAARGLEPSGALLARALQASGHDHGAAVTPVQKDEGAAQARPDMMAGMAAMDARLKTLTAEMNAATGDAKIAAMAKLLTTLVEQRSAMRDQMMRMGSDMESERDMMTRMQQRMKSGDGAGMKKKDDDGRAPK